MERAIYVRHWLTRKAKLEALHEELGLNLGDESRREIRRVQEFAHRVDDILCFLNDILVPRKLEVHLDDGFLAVREALRRRLEER